LNVPSKKEREKFYENSGCACGPWITPSLCCPTIGQKLDQGGRYMQGSLGGTIFIQVDYPTAQLCSNELRATTMKDTDITCNLASAESTLPNKGSTTDKVIGIKYPMHFKTDQTCGFYKTALEGITDKAAIACNQ
jgi:hypothetical protein